MSRTKAWTAAGAAAAGVAAVATGGVLALAPSSHAATGTAAARISECRAVDVSAGYHATDAGMSHRFGRITVTNTSHSACVLQGFGGLSYVGGGNGTQIGSPATRTPSAAPRLVLQPGDSASSQTSAAVASVYPKASCRPAHVDGFRVYLPDETHALFVKHPTTGCRSTSVSLLQHKAFR